MSPSPADRQPIQGLTTAQVYTLAAAVLREPYGEQAATMVAAVLGDNKVTGAELLEFTEADFGQLRRNSTAADEDGAPLTAGGPRVRHLLAQVQAFEKAGGVPESIMETGPCPTNSN